MNQEFHPNKRLSDDLLRKRIDQFSNNEISINEIICYFFDYIYKNIVPTELDMIQLNYPNYTKDRKLHAGLVNQCLNFNMLANKNRISQKEIVDFINTWFKEHENSFREFNFFLKNKRTI